MTSGKKDETSKKMDDDREIWKRLIYANKAKHIEDFKTIEDNYNKNYEASIQFIKEVINT